MAKCPCNRNDDFISARAEICYLIAIIFQPALPGWNSSCNHPLRMKYRCDTKLTFGLSDIYMFAVFARDGINRITPFLPRCTILRFRENMPQGLKRFLGNFKGAMSPYFCCFLVKTSQVQFPIAFTCGWYTYLNTRRSSPVKICEIFFRKDLPKVDSGPKTRSVQSENLKTLANFFKL